MFASISIVLWLLHSFSYLFLTSFHSFCPEADTKAVPPLAPAVAPVEPVEPVEETTEELAEEETKGRYWG